MTTKENQIKQSLITKLKDLKHTYREDICDKATLKQNFRKKFEALNRVHFTDSDTSPNVGLRDKATNPTYENGVTKTRWFWDKCDKKSRGTSGKNRIRPEKLLEISIPLLSFDEQQYIVNKIGTLHSKIYEATQFRKSILSDTQAMLHSVFEQTIEGTEYQPMAEVASLERRKIEIDFNSEYPELGVHCFGKSTFHKPVLDGIDVGTKKLYQMVPGDLVFSNVFAWKGAIAVVEKEDEDHVASHRFMTCESRNDIVTSHFLCFLVNERLEKIQAASPGGGGRNRLPGLKKLEKIEVPVPDYQKQLWLNQLQYKVDKIKQAQAENTVELGRLMPSILDKAFKGGLL